MNYLSQRIAALTPEQQALLKQRLTQKTNQHSHTWVIPKREQSLATLNHLPVSFAQQRMWFQDQLGHNSAVSNNISISLQIAGCLQVSALEQSLTAILQRHEVLRTTLHSISGELTQVIHSIEGWELPIVDLQTLTPDQQALEVQRLATEQACQPFNLEIDLLFRTTLIKLSATQHVLLLTLHHIAVDAWSIGIFFRELSVLYGAFSTDQPAPLAPLPIQYSDFAIWQRQTLRGDLLTTDLTYWQQKLHQAPDLLHLPIDRPRPAIQSFAGRTRSFLLPKSLTESLRQLSQQAEATLFTTLLAALQTLLFRYTAQDDILVGTPIANRQQPEIEPLIGCFINTLVLRTNLSGNPSFQTLLQQVRNTVLEALAHQTLPFEKLVDQLQVARNLSYSPLFQVMLVLQNAFSIEQIELPDLQVEHERIDNNTAQFDLTFHLVEADTGLIGKLEYNTNLFDDSTIERLIGHFQTLLTSIVANPAQRLSELPILTPAECLRLGNCNHTTVTDTCSLCIHKLFEAQVQETPNAIAVVQGDQQITYQDLDRRANQLANYLQKIGVQPESLVGMCVDRSITMIVGLLAILKAGGAYVPLDPSAPSQRLEMILTDAQVSVLLTQQSLVAKLPELSVSRICLDTEWDVIGLESPDSVTSSSHTANLAYIIYTSGSTGKPKGVMVEQQSLVNFTEAAIAHYEIQTRDRILQFASLSFDAAAEEIFPCLVQGATLVLRTDSMLSSMARFLQTCADWQLTVLDLPTAFWHQLVTEMVEQNLALPDSVRLVILGGEKALFDRFLLWQQINSSARLVNSYGPTEATIVTTIMDLSQLPPATLEARTLPIGQPIQNAITYVLDAELQPVPIGIPGELYIGGAGVARGYLNCPDLTAKAFISNPFSNRPEARLYKTGDRVRYRADGNLEFLGRIDRQVKIRGFRIELGEIEALLLQYPSVQETVLLDREVTPGDKRLVAYVVPVSHHTLTPQELRQFLETRLPAYMVPASFVVLSQLPLNANGKIDRQQLPAPDLAQSAETSGFVAPRTATEVEVARSFAEVLNLKEIGANDDFFELGGHSLLATKLLAHLLSVFPVALSIVDLFQSPIVASLAAQIDQKVSQRPSINEKPILSTTLQPRLEPPATPIPLSFSQQYIWEMYQNGAGTALNSSIVLRVTRSLTPAILERSWNELIRRHEILRTVFKPINGQPRQVILPDVHLSLNYIDLQPYRPEERESIAFNQVLEITQRPFDLSVAPLFRTVLWQLSPQESWLLITMHHIITDGWSFGVLLHELESLIQSFSNQLPLSLPEVSLQYADFAAWQQQVYDQASISQQFKYWQQKLIKEAPPLSSSTLLAQPLLSKQASHYFTQLPAVLFGEIESLSRTVGLTNFVVLLAALKLALAAWSGQSDIWILTTVGNRTVSGTEQMLGCFINDVILRSQISPEQTGTSFMKQLQVDVQEAIDHKEVPLEWVIEHLEQFHPCNFMGSLTISSTLQNIAQIPGWEVVPISNQQQLHRMSSELSADDTPLEIYIELSNPIEITVSYSTQLWTAEMIDRLFTLYHQILAALVVHPESHLLDFLNLEEP